MSSDELRKAAETLRQRAQGAEQGVWAHAFAVEFADPERRNVITDIRSSVETDRFIATMHPGVGLALADWLDDEATTAEEAEAMGYTIGPRYGGLVISRLINGGAL